MDSPFFISVGGIRICPAAKAALSVFLITTYSQPLSSADSSLQNFVHLSPLSPVNPPLLYPWCSLAVTEPLQDSSNVSSLWRLLVDQGSQVQFPSQGHLQHGLFNDKPHTPVSLCLCSCYSFCLEIWCSPLLPTGTFFFWSLKVQLKYHFLSSFFTYPLCSQPQDELLHNLCSQRTWLIPLSES